MAARVPAAAAPDGRVIDPQQRRLAAAALAVAGEHGFALAGGLALAAHGVGDRPSDDIDLFTSNTDPKAFSVAVDAVHEAFRTKGWTSREERRGPPYARVMVDVAPRASYELDLAVDYRARPAVAIADIGPVLDVVDAVGSKMAALYGRGEVRDYVDVRETVIGGRFTRDEVLALADEREVHPLDRAVLANRLRQASHLPGRELGAYLNLSEATELRTWFTDWADELDPAPDGAAASGPGARPRIAAPKAPRAEPDASGPSL